MSRESFIIATSWEPDRDQFFEMLGIRAGGIGTQFFGDVFDCLFNYSTDLRREYERYYSVEYATLGDYIQIAIGKRVSDEGLEKTHVYLVKHIPTLIDSSYEDHQLDVVIEAIKRLGADHENQN